MSAFLQAPYKYFNIFGPWTADVHLRLLNSCVRNVVMPNIVARPKKCRIPLCGTCLCACRAAPAPAMHWANRSGNRPRPQILDPRPFPLPSVSRLSNHIAPNQTIEMMNSAPKGKIMDPKPTFEKVGDDRACRQDSRNGRQFALSRFAAFGFTCAL